jgi:DNA-binding NarL/FixJ family response regulator
MRIRIALVEDNAALRNSFKDNIQYFSHIELVLVANNGIDFLQKMQQQPQENFPEIVLTDIEMDGMDGIQTVAEGHKRYPALQFIMLTVFDNDEKIFDSILAGAVGYMLKDETPDKIVEAIEEVKAGGAPMSPAIARRTLQLLRQQSKPEVTPEAHKESGGDAASAEDVLSRRELEILEKIVEGLTYQQIAKLMFISPHTVRTHIQHIYEKLHVHSKAAIIRMAVDKKWFSFKNI